MSSNTNRAVASLEEAISALEAERDQLDDQIKLMQDTLAKLTGSAPKKKRGPGRPPGSPNRKKPGPKPGSKRKASTTKAAVKRKASWTPAKRKATSERMKKYWADRRKAKK